MISLILYGRNDSYGYNLHKRAAISLNCMAEMLTAPNDEIIFVDYNTPDDFPTFPEAIQDTLTARAKRLLRILRVRPSQHEPFREQTKLVALEPIARNVAVRRSNPDNRWVLSTNTDMVFVPQRGATLSAVAEVLPDGYYHLPRFELPETLWESLDRLDPAGTIASIGNWGRTFHLNEIVFASDPMVRYDAPGDFQLILRSDLWEVHGFNESMLLGWHVDSNMAKRLALVPRRIGDVLDDVFGYHCDHTRQVTPMHRRGATENDLQVFFEDVTIPQLPTQADTWGLAGETVEELRIDSTSRVYLEALRSTIGSPLMEPTQLHYSGETYNRTSYLVDHIVPFLADIFASYPRSTVLGWIGAKKALLQRFSEMWSAMGFSEPIMVSSQAEWLGSELPANCISVMEEVLAEDCDVFLFDWGRADCDCDVDDWEFEADPIIRAVTLGFRRMVRVEQDRLVAGSGPLRRFIGVNAINNEVERLFNDRIGAARTPIATRIRQGYIHGDLQGDLLDGNGVLVTTQDLMPILHAGSAGRKENGTIVASPGVAGFVFFGPYLDLDREGYRLTLGLDSSTAQLAQGNSGLVIAILSNGYLLRHSVISFEQLSKATFQIEFNNSKAISDAQNFPKVEFRLLTTGKTDLTLCSAVLEEADVARAASEFSSDFDCLPLLIIGEAGSPVQTHRGLAIQAKPGVVEYLVFGPYIWLLPGHYEATFVFEAERAELAESSSFLKAEVVTHLGSRILAERKIKAFWSEHWFETVFRRRKRKLTAVLEFDIATEALPQHLGLLEFRIWSPGTIRFNLVGLNVRNVGAPIEADPQLPDVLADPDLLSQLTIGKAGTLVLADSGLAIQCKSGIADFLVHGPYTWLPRGHYEATFEFDIVRAERESAFNIEVVTHFGSRILAARSIRTHWRGKRFESVLGTRKGPQTCTLEFDIATEAPLPEEGLLEYRVWSPGTIRFTLLGLSVRRISAAQEIVAEAIAVAP